MWTETPVQPPKAGTSGKVTFAANTRGKGAWVGVPAAISNQLGWRPGQKLVLMTGAGEHDGWLRLEAKSTGAAELQVVSKKNNGGRIRLGNFLRLSANTFAKAACEHRVNGRGVLDIKLPPGALTKPKAVGAA